MSKGRKRNGGDWCAAPECHCNKGKCPERSFFHFPKDELRCKQWVEACGRNDFAGKPAGYLHSKTLCSRHFEERMFLNFLKNRLKPDAVPSLFLKVSNPQLMNVPPSSPTLQDEELPMDIQSVPPPSQSTIKEHDDSIPLHNLEEWLIVDESGVNNSITTSSVSIHPKMSKAENLLDVPSTPCRSEERLNYLSPPEEASTPIRFFDIQNSKCNNDSNGNFLAPSLISTSAETTINTSGTQNSTVTSYFNSNFTSRSLTMESKECQTGARLSSNTPRKTKLRKKIVLMRQKEIREKRKISPIVKKTEKYDLKLFERMCDHFLAPSVASIAKMQARLHKCKPKGRRYTLEFKKFALQLYFLGPKCYRFLMDKLILPTPRTLRSLTQRIKMRPGFNEEVFTLLKEKIQLLPLKSKICAVSLDEMSLKKNLCYVPSRDEIIGFHDIGQRIVEEEIVNEAGETEVVTKVYSGKSYRPATSALVLMVRGIDAKWKQQVAYFFTSSSASQSDLKEIVETGLTKLQEIGLDSVSFGTDQGPNMLKFSRQQGVTIETPFFFVNGYKVVYLFDPPHLIKSIRNNLLNHTFHFDGKIASWKDIEDLYQIDKQQNDRLAPDLSDVCIAPNDFQKMRVNLAVKVISATVSSALNTLILGKQLNSEAEGTADFVKAFDKLFDICNSSKQLKAKEFNRSYKGAAYQEKFLTEMEDFINTLEVRNQRGEVVTSGIRCLKGWLLTMSAIRNLWDDLKNRGFSHLNTRRLCQDGLENFFCAMRQQGGNSVNPTPIMFERNFKKLFTLNYFHQSKLSNCTQDFDAILSSVNEKNLELLANKFEDPKDAEERSAKEVEIKRHDFEDLDHGSRNAVKYVSGYLIDKALKVHTCDVCQEYANRERDIEPSSMFCLFKGYGELFGKLKMPCQQFCELVAKMGGVFKFEFENASMDQPQRLLYNICSDIDFHHPCPEFPTAYVIKLYLRMKTFHALKYFNRSFKSREIQEEDPNGAPTEASQEPTVPRPPKKRKRARRNQDPFPTAENAVPALPVKKMMIKQNATRAVNRRPRKPPRKLVILQHQ